MSFQKSSEVEKKIRLIIRSGEIPAIYRLQIHNAYSLLFILVCLNFILTDFRTLDDDDRAAVLKGT